MQNEETQQINGYASNFKEKISNFLNQVYQVSTDLLKHPIHIQTSKEFQKLTEIICHWQTEIDTSKTVSEYDTENIKITTIYSLLPFYRGEHGDNFKKPALNLLISAWLFMQQNELKKADDELNIKQIIEKANSPLGTAITKILLTINSQNILCIKEHNDIFPMLCLAGMNFNTNEININEQALMLFHNVLAPNINLIGANLKHASLQGSIFKMAKMQGINLQKANLQNAALTKANLNFAKLEKANLQDTILIRANLKQAKLQKANLQGAKLAGAKLWKSHLKKAILEKANLQGANLIKANLKKTILLETNMQDVLLQGATLNNANLQKAVLRRAILKGTDLEDANLQEVNLKRANLQGANLQGANLQGANLQGANLQGANLQGANLQDTNLKDAVLDKEQIDYIKQHFNDVLLENS